MRDDPCFSCALPDCDERDRRCNVRRLANSYHTKNHRAESHLVTEAERVAANRLFILWTLERKAEASEGGRPYRRGKSVYGERQP